jgi:hypothetical protein
VREERFDKLSSSCRGPCAKGLSSGGWHNRLYKGRTAAAAPSFWHWTFYFFLFGDQLLVIARMMMRSSSMTRTADAAIRKCKHGRIPPSSLSKSFAIAGERNDFTRRGATRAIQQRRLARMQAISEWAWQCRQSRLRQPSVCRQDRPQMNGHTAVAIGMSPDFCTCGGIETENDIHVAAVAHCVKSTACHRHRAGCCARPLFQSCLGPSFPNWPAKSFRSKFAATLTASVVFIRLSRWTHWTQAIAHRNFAYGTQH